MGVCKIARWFKTAARSDRDVQTASPMSQDNRNEYYRNLLQQFASHCQTSNGDITDSDWVVYVPKEQNAEQSSKKDNQRRKHAGLIPGVPQIQASEIFEIGYVAGTENRCLELVSAEWHNTKVTLKRHVLPACRDAIKADVEVLSEIRHPNILLLMAATYTNEHGLVSIFEPVDCTLYSYIHEQGERMNIQGIIQIGIKLADALKYCHMRGYVHTAISSHCVYFASDKSVKLGGWELAKEIENFYVEHDYERYLRLENFKWQAPAICYGRYPSKKIDIYCLMLLLWEMCTGNVPWSGYDQSNTEKQYMRKCDVIINLQNVPSILRNLLEAGLHCDEAKIMLDMDKIERKLHRLLMIQEEDEKNCTYMSENGNNNNDLLYNDTLCRKNSPPSPVQNKEFIKTPDAIQLHRPVKEKRSSSKQLFKSKNKQEQCNGNLNSKSDIKRTNASAISDSIISPVIKVKTTTPCTRCEEISDIVQDDKNNARANIKRLKEFIASRREDFFFGNDSTFSSCSPASPKATSTLLSRDRSPDYIQCKPASHAITMEPKCNKSPTEYCGAVPKSSYMPRRKAPYTGMPAIIKHAIVQPQVLHSDAKSFYESTLWKKEKEICMSRMARDGKEDEKCFPQQLICSVTPITDDAKAVLTNANATYTLEVLGEGNCSEDNKESPLKDVRSDRVSPKVSISPNKSIQDLKNALDRATEIIRSGKPSKICNSKFSAQKCEITFEDLHGARYDDDQEIEVVKRSLFGNKSSLGMDEVKSAERDNIKTSTGREEIFNQAFIGNETLDSGIVKTSNESRNSTPNQQPTSPQEDNRDRIAFTNRTESISRTRIDLQSNEREYVNVDTLKSIEIRNSPRRLSLPVGLNNLTMLYTPIKNTRRISAQDNQYTTEDIYIDDEFGNKLNYNLALLDDDYEHMLSTVLNDNEGLPQTTEL